MSKKLIQAAAGAGGEAVYVEDVFSTYVYEGNGSSITVNNGIDLSGEGGMVWVKNRNSTSSHAIYDTERGPSTGTSSSTNKTLGTDLSNPEGIGGNVAGITSFNSNGFTTASNQISPYNVTGPSSQDYVSWSFRKQPGFFDVVTWTGDGTSGRTVSHNLGSIPGLVIIKSISDTTNWKVWHRDLGNNWLELNTTSAVSSETYFPSSPTATELTLSGNGNVNGSGSPSKTYVAYLFAHDDQSFGDDSDESIIKCGSYTGNGSSQDINLGFEPQWLMIKKSSAAGSWQIIDTMRGMPVDAGSTKYLLADSSGAEYGSGAEYQAQPTATGFKLGLSNDVNQSGVTFIYIAIRRPMKTPEAGTEVFKPTAYTGTEPTPQYFTTGFTVDANIYKYRDAAIGALISDRLRGGPIYSLTSDTSAEGDLTGNAASAVFNVQFERNDGFSVGSGAANAVNDVIAYSFKRATGFFDVVAYTGTGSNATQNHNLGVEPEIIFFKKRSTSGSNWTTYSRARGATKYLLLNGTDAEATFNHFQDTDPTSTEFYLTSAQSVNQSAETFIAYLFATVAGVSKVGSYTGTGSNLDVDCGFSSGARFVLIKRADDTGGWYVWDSERGIVAGNDPYLLLNSTAAEVTTTDYIDPLSSGFTVTSSAPIALNLNGGTYIFLAIA